MFSFKIYFKNRIWKLVIICLPVVSHAQHTENIFLRKYLQQDGLSSFLVRQVHQDKNGFLYIATQEGLDRFDGKTFFHYSKNNNKAQQLAGIDIRMLAEDSSSNILWVLPGENGINAINTITGKVERFIAIPKENDNEWNLSLLADPKKLFIGTTVGVKIYNLEQNRFEGKLPLYNINNSVAAAYQARVISRDAHGNIWVCYNDYGIVIYNKQLQLAGFIPAATLLDPVKKGGAIRFNQLVFSGNNTALIATGKGLRKVVFSDKGEPQLIENKPALNNFDINNLAVQSILVGKKGNVYVANSKYLFRFNSTLSAHTIMQETLYDEGNNWLANVVNIFEDRDDNIWLGCNQGLAFFKTFNNPFSAIYQLSGTGERLEHATSIFKSSVSDIFIGSFNGLAVASYPYSAYKIYDKGYIFHQVFEDPYKRIHASRSDRMFIYDDNKGLIPIEKIYPEFVPFSASALNSRAFLNDSTIALGTENYNGILLWDHKNHRVQQVNEKTGKVKLGSGIVNALFKDSKQNLWVLSDNIITIINSSFTASQVLNIADEHSSFPAGLFFDMCEMNGKFWVASYGTGIVMLDENRKQVKVLSTRDGLSNSGVYKIFPYKDNLLITTNYGLSVYNNITHVFKNYFRADGLHSNNFEEAVGLNHNDTILAGGIRGISVIQPELLMKNVKAPSLFINRISLESHDGKTDSSNLFLDKYIIPSNTNQATIYFSGLNYLNPDRTTFAYRIPEKSPDWINIGTRNFVSLIGLSPGTYLLEIKAANEDGVWSESKQIILKFLPKWYQTLWFKLLLLFIIAAFIYLLYRYRIGQIRKQHEIRKVIATDLHDDLGSTLTSVKVFTNLAISGINQEASLRQVKDNLTEATMSLRDIIWVLDDSLDTVDELITRLKLFALPLAAASNIQAEIKAGSDIKALRLTKEEKRNLFLICKEAINNSIKYSGASKISVIITAKNKKIQLLVTDNGKGFDAETVKKGYGLKNMQYRARQIRYAVKLSSSLGMGTEINILPA